VRATSGPLFEEVIGESVDSEAESLSSRMHEGTPIKSHIAEFLPIINDLDKIEVKIENDDQAFLLLCSLPFSYKRFREAIYEDNSTIKVNEVKEHLFNKDKIDNQ